MFNSWARGGAGQRTLLLELERAERRKEQGQREQRPKESAAALRWMTLLKGRRGRSPHVKSFLQGARCTCAGFTVYQPHTLNFPGPD